MKMSTLILIIVCLVIGTISCMPFYESLCPDPPQRKLRSQGRCKNNLTHPEYFCLFDTNRQSYVELCRKEPDFQRPGFKFIFRGSLDGIECDTKHYQPFKLWTNVSSECLFRKSECNEEGQIPVHKGNITSDKSCRCDYTQGYAFIKTPKNKCMCMPSVEDCTCFRKFCEQNYVLTPDYDCVMKSDWTGHFSCPDVKKDMSGAHLLTTPCPTLASPEDLLQTLTKLEKVLPVTVVVLSGFVVAAVFIACISGYNMVLSRMTTGIYGKLKEENAIKASVDKILQEKEEKERIPTTIRDIHYQCIQEWKEDDEKFIETVAAKEIEKKLTDLNCVNVVGRAGNGKSSIVRHIALKLNTENDYEIIPIVIGPSNILQYHNPRRNQVFVIDDFCGKLVINPPSVYVWSSQFDEIFKLMNEEKKSSVKFLITTGRDIYDDNIFKHLDCLEQYVVKLSELPLQENEKREMIKKYIPPKMEPEFKSDKDYFPLLCKISEGKSAEQIKKLFLNLDEFIKNDLLNLKSKRSLQFCFITCCALFNNRFKTRMLDGEFSSDQEHYAFDEICMEFNLGLHKESTRNRLKGYLNSLENAYVAQTEDFYHFIHVKVYQVAAILCGQTFVNCFIKFASHTFIADHYRFKLTNPEETGNVIWINDIDTENRYFDRLIKDLKDGITYSTFHNSQLHNKLYRDHFCTYFKSRKQKVVELLHNLNDISQSTSTKNFHECEENNHILDDKSLEYDDYINFEKQHHFSSHKMHKPMLESAWEGNEDIIKLLIEMELDINEIDRFGRSALIVASYRGKTEVVKLLLEKNADHSLLDKKNQSALSVASREGNIEIVKLLLEKNADTSVPDFEGCTPFLAACGSCHKSVAELLLKKNADTSVCDNMGQSSIFLACLNECKDVIKYLISKSKTDLVNKCNKKGLSPLSIACMKGNADIVEILIEAGADISTHDSDNKTPLFIACQEGYTNVVEILVNKGADVMTCDWHKQTLLTIACERGHYNIVIFLLESKSSLINLCDDEGRSPLFIACKKGNATIVNILLSKSANITQFDNKKRSPFYAACRYGHLEIAKILHKNGAYPSDCTKWGGTPLFAACREGHEKIVKYLINEKVDLLKRDSNGTSPLLVACEEGNLEIAKLLIEKEAGVNTCNNEDRCPLHSAVFGGHVHIVKALINNGADNTLKDVDGHTPLDIAKERGFSEIEKVLNVGDS